LNHVRHAAIFDATRLSVSIIGCGGIGAATALAISKMGVPYVTLIDDDVVSEANLPTQLHKLSALGMPKVQAVAEMIAEFSDDLAVVDTQQRRIDGSEPLSDQVIISCVDSIQARQDIWKSVQAGKCQLYLESRMGAEEFQLHCVDPKDAAWYDKFINSQSDADILDAPCTSKATFFCGMLAAASISAVVKAFIVGDQLPHKIAHNIPRYSLMEM
jgi:molybdopterin/thiamine biosynthesis adenylyltransferase